jgi:hypothetical protein
MPRCFTGNIHAGILTDLLEAEYTAEVPPAAGQVDVRAA